MTNLSSVLVRVALALALSLPAATAYAAVDVLVGDKDGFGFASPCSDTGSCPGLSSPPIDNRSAAEAAATNGAQITDVYTAIFGPSFGPNTTSSADVVFPFSGTLTSGTLSFAAGDFQSDVFGPLTATINGVSTPFFFADGRFVTAIHSITLTAAEIAAANAAQQVVLHLDRGSSLDFIAFDWFELTGDTSGAAVPEPSTLLLVGSTLGTLGWMRRRRGRERKS